MERPLSGMQRGLAAQRGLPGRCDPWAKSSAAPEPSVQRCFGQRTFPTSPSSQNRLFAREAASQA